MKREMFRFPGSTLLVWLSLTTVFACSSDAGNDGTGGAGVAGGAGAPCYPNGTCDAGLVCAGGLCITASDAVSDASDGASDTDEAADTTENGDGSGAIDTDGGADTADTSDGSGDPADTTDTDTDTSPDTDTDTSPDTDTDTTPVETRIGPDGGVVEFDGIRLTIPAGALAELTPIAISYAADQTPEGYATYTAVYRFEPAGTTFAIPAIVSARFEGNAGRATLFWTPEGSTGFERRGGSVGADGRLEDRITHFSEGFVGDGVSYTDLSDRSCVVTKLLEGRDATNAGVNGGLGLFFTVDDCQGRPITGLTGADFTLLENDRPLSSEAQASILPADGRGIFVSLVLDFSASTEPVLPELLNGATTFLDSLEAARLPAQVQIMAFGGETSGYVAQRYTLDLAAARAALTGLSAWRPTDIGATNLHGAVVQALGESEAAQAAFRARNLGGAFSSGYVVVFTDGSDTAERVPLVQVQSAVAGSADGLFMVGLRGADYDEAALTAIAPARNVLAAPSAAELSREFAALANRLSGQALSTYLLGYCSPKRSGSHTVSVQVSGAENRSTASFDFGADGFDGTCRAAAFATVCDGNACGGLGCGACDDRNRTCVESGSSFVCEDQCVVLSECSGTAITTPLGYSLVCAETLERTQCGRGCVDAGTDENNCGACGVRCSDTEGCNAGVCGPPVCAGGCAADEICAPPGECAPGPTSGFFGYVSNIQLPRAGSPADCCFDLNGDGAIDNGFGSFVGALGAISPDTNMQTAFEVGIVSGSEPWLFSLAGSDAALSDGNVRFASYRATNDLNLDGIADQVWDPVRRGGGGVFQVLSDSFGPEGSPFGFERAELLDGQVTSLSGAMPIHLPWNDVGASGIAIIVNAFFPTGFILRDARVSASLRVESSRLFTNNELIDSELDGTPEVWGGVQLGGVVRMEESLTILNGLLSDCACAGIAPTDQVLVFGEGVDQFEIACDPNITINDSRCLPADGALCNSLSTLCGFAPALPSLGIIDVDTNGNGSPDAVSVGMRLTLVGATLASPPVAPNICGDGVLAAPETCDDRNRNSGDGCSAACRTEYCGDGIVQAALGESCEDGNALSDDGCSSACEAEFCGDGVVQAGLGEACDDGNNSDGDGCTAICVVETCGNGRLETVLGENCDDGNGYDGDNCSSACSICVDDAGEPDSLLSARNINPISCAVGSLNLDGLIAQSGNPDYFTFILPVGGSIVSSLQSDAEGVSFDLLDTAGELIQAGVASGSIPGLVELNWIPESLIGGSLILRANAEAAAECIAYSISVCTTQG